MKILAVLICLLATEGATSQVRLTFSPQPSDIRARTQIRRLTLYLVVACAAKDAAAFSGGRIYEAAATKVTPVAPATVLELARKVEGRSAARNTLLVLEGLSYGLGTVVAADVIKFKEPELRKALTAAPVALGLTLRIATSVVKQRAPDFGLPSDIVPPYVQLAPGQCQQFSLYVWRETGQKPFSLEVGP